MLCWLPTRLLYNASRAACGGGGTHTSQVRDGVYRLLCIVPDTPTHSSSPVTRSYSAFTHTTKTCHQVDSSCSWQTETSPQNVIIKGAESIKKDDLLMVNPEVDESSEMNSKRPRELLSPVRPLPKKKVKGNCQSRERVTNPTTLDFIPLPSSPPQEKGDLGDFFVIDTNPSEVDFPELTSRNKCNRGSTNSESEVLANEHNSKRVDSVGDNGGGECTRHNQVRVSYDCDVVYVHSTSKFEKKKSLDENKYNGDKKKKKKRTNGIGNSKEKSKGLTRDDDIDILYEGPSRQAQDEVMVVCTVNTNQKDENHLLSSRRSPALDGQSRKCHTSTRQGLKTKPNDIQPEEIISLQPKSVRGKGKEPENCQKREASPDIQKVNVIDPDVVEIEEPPASGSKREDGVEVIDIFGSDHEDTCSTSSSDHEVRDMDVSTTEFISLQKLCVRDLENTEIDISDETLKLRKRLEKLRKWEMTGLGQEIIAGKNVKPTDTMFTVMSYNVLAQALLTDNMRLYSSCKEEHLSWPYRWALLQHEIQDLDPDILMLQEVQASHYHSYYLPWFGFKGYDGLYKKRTGIKADGCAIFFKKSKFSMIEHSSVEFLQPEARNVLDRDNIGLIVKLMPVSQPNLPAFCVATTHLLYNPHRHDIKLAQVVLLLSEIDRLCYESEEGGRTKYCPVIITGDFNAEPHSALLRFIKEGHLHYEGLARKTLARHGVCGPFLGPNLLPSSLGLTDRCQHSVLAQSRFLEQSRGPIFSLSDKRKLEESLIRLYHSDRNAPTRKISKSTNRGSAPSGWFSHGFNFHSVYRHRLSRSGGAPEATTHQNGWTSVDYVMYSRAYSNSLGRPVEGNLKLLARYGLLSGKEAERYAPLPSAVCPSDHFPLAAQFLLRK
ncbi:uncharacterized protein [Panulirus ornatus]